MTFWPFALASDLRRVKAERDRYFQALQETRALVASNGKFIESVKGQLDRDKDFIERLAATNESLRLENARLEARIKAIEEMWGGLMPSPKT